MSAWVRWSFHLLGVINPRAVNVSIQGWILTFLRVARILQRKKTNKKNSPVPQLCVTSLIVEGKIRPVILI